LGLRGVVTLPGREARPHQTASATNGGVHLGAQAPAGAAQTAAVVGLRFFSSGNRQLVVATEWALTVVESKNPSAKSPSPFSSASHLRIVTKYHFEHQAAELDVQVQFCTDLDNMPIEDALVEWPEEESPHRTAARLVFPPQNAYSDARQDHVDHLVTFSPAHCLALMRPLGSIMRARMQVYPTIQKMRHAENGKPIAEPTRAADVPD
jgi:hypothetical protein